jgi:photosystem II stability/assembly factor-like uncharacterized protein
MENAELEPDFSMSSYPEPAARPARVARGVALICGSMLVITVAALTYVHPTLQSARTAANAKYRVSALDFVDSETGWVVVDFDSGGYAILHTDDAGLSWTRQLTARGPGHSHYLKFFDSAVGVFGMLGTTPELYRSSDGGRTWTALPVPKLRGAVLSWSWVDSYFGWFLMSGTDPEWPLPTYLFRTEDGGLTWKNLGVPAPAPDRVFEASFSYLTTGWLSSANGGAYVYKTRDFGDTWIRVPLPAPAGGWPTGGEFLVAVQPTAGDGVAATVVFVPTLQGRKGQGAIIRDFPPLTVRAFDGGRPVTYVYATIGEKNLGPIPQAQAPNQTQLGTMDGGATWRPIALPSANGAVAFADAADWWWIGEGQLASSRDGGASWSSAHGINAHAPVPGTLQVVDPQHAWFATSDNSLEATADSGLRWRSVALPGLSDAPGV